MKTHLHTIRKTIDGFFGMNDAAWSVMRGTMLVCCALALAAFIIIVGLGQITTANYYLYESAIELAQAPPALLLLAALVSAFIEEQLRGS